MSPAVEDYMEKFWGYFAFVANSLVFILMGLLFADLSIDLNVAILPIGLAICVVAVGRAVSIYPSIGLLNIIGREEPIPKNWMHLLSWGSLRGALAVIMVLLIPNDVTVPGWTYTFSVKQFVAALTIGSIYFTLLVKATTIGKVVRALKIDALSPEENVGYYKSKAQMYDDSLQKINALFSNEQLNKEQHDELHQHYQHLYHNACLNCKDAIGSSDHLVENLLRMYALGIEKGELKDIFQRGEINEKIYKKILNMLSIQTDRIERGTVQVYSAEEHFPIDGLERFVLMMSRLAFWRDHTFKDKISILYYRTLNRLLTCVIEQFSSVATSSSNEIFDDKLTLERLLAMYKELLANTQHKMAALIHKNADLLHQLNLSSATISLHAVQLEALDNLHKNEIISDKLYIMLHHEILNKKSS